MTWAIWSWATSGTCPSAPEEQPLKAASPRADDPSALEEAGPRAARTAASAPACPPQLSGCVEALKQRCPPDSAAALEALREKAWRWWPALACAGVVLLGLCCFGITTGFSAGRLAHPYWEVEALEFNSIDIPGLMVKGVSVANTDKCPPDDLCGLGHAQGCSVCPESGMWNQGCLCTQNGHGNSAPAGTVVDADTSNCPADDRCGVGPAIGCTLCPDDSWINEGCTCRQPLSPEKFLERVDGFFMGLLGMSKSVVKAEVVARVRVENPAAVGAEAEPGNITIHFGDEVIGSASTKRLYIQASSSTVMNVTVHIDHVPDEVGMRMLKEILENGNQLSVHAVGSITAKVAVASVKCHVDCHVTTDVSQLPDPAVTRRHCDYQYNL